MQNEPAGLKRELGVSVRALQSDGTVITPEKQVSSRFE